MQGANLSVHCAQLRHGEMAVRVFSLRCRQLLRKYESSKVSMEVRCLSSLLGTTENVRSTEVPQKTAVRHHRPAARAGSLLAYYSGDNHALKPRPRGSSRRRSLYTSLAVSNGGATVDSTHKAFYSTTYGTTSGSGSGGSEDDGGVEGSTKGEEGISSGVPEESNLQAYAQEVSGCEECHPDTAARDQELEGLLRNIEIAKTAQTLQDSIPVKRKPSRVGTRRSSPMTIEELVAFLHEERAVGVCVIRLPSEMDYVNYFVTCSGMGARHIRRIADNLAAEVR